MDETYIKVGGKDRYLYRAVDKYGNTVDVLLTKRRMKGSAQKFLNKAIGNNGFINQIKPNDHHPGTHLHRFADPLHPFGGHLHHLFTPHQGLVADLHGFVTGSHRFVTLHRGFVTR